MNHFDDDDQLIAGAFADFDDVAAPTMSAIGTAPLHTKAIRYRRTRATILGIAAALVVALPVATYAALGQENQGPPPGPAESRTPGIETPAPVTSSPTPSTTPSTAPSAPPDQSTTQTPFAVAYFAVPVNDKVEVYSYTGGKATLAATIADPYETVRATISVSPDATRLAWVEDGGALVMANIDGTRKQTLLSGVATAGKDAPMWTPDSKRLVTGKGTVDVVTRQVTTTKLKGTYQVWSPGFQFTAYETSSPSRVIVERADGTKMAEVPTICTNCESNAKSVLALSPDGRYVALGGWPTAGGREQSWREILDTRSRAMALTLNNAPNSGRFLADGTFVLHDRDKIKLMRVDGTVITTIQMPEALRVHEGPPALRYPILLLVK